MTQTDKLNRVNKVIELARELYVHQGLDTGTSLHYAEMFLDQADEYRETKRKEILTGKGE